MRLTEAKILVLDTETTGVDPAEARVVELGGVLVEGGRVTTRLRTLVNPGVPIPAEASNVHGITDAHVAAAPRFISNQVAARLVDRACDADVRAGYNVLAYDFLVINAELDRAREAGFVPEGETEPLVTDRFSTAWPALDVLVFVRHHLRGMRERKLGAVADYFGVPLVNAHSAAADCEATAGVLFEMVRDDLIPDDLDEALEHQARYLEIQAAENERWSYWLYEDRRAPGALRMGAGKHCGAALCDVPTRYLGYLLDNVEDLPPATREAFQAAIRSRADNRRSTTAWTPRR